MNENETKKKKKSDRNKFNFMKSFYEAVETLPKKDKPEMYEAIIKYSFEDNYEPHFKGTLATVWILIKPILDNSFKQFQNGSSKSSD